MPTLADRGLISDARDRPESEKAACFASLCPTRSGAILSAYQVGPEKNAATSTIRLSRSDDGGRTWNELPARFETTLEGMPGSLAAAEMVETPAGNWLLFATWFDRRDPERPLFDPETGGILPTRQIKAVSRDQGRTWSPWQILRTPGLTGCATTGPAVLWSDGTIGYAFESFKEFDDPEPAQHGAWLLLSRDGGRTFPLMHLVARDPEGQRLFWDQRLCPGAHPGEYIAMFWTHDREQQKDLRVHLRQGSIAEHDPPPMPTETPIEGQIAAPLLLPDGRLLAFVVDRGQPGTMTLLVSPDGGATWPPEERLVVYTHDEQAHLTQGREQIDFAQYWEDMGRWTFGHPALRLLPDGHLLAAFYAGTPDALSIHWARIALT